MPKALLGWYALELEALRMKHALHFVDVTVSHVHQSYVIGTPKATERHI
jgi:hypothetical protein